MFSSCKTLDEAKRLFKRLAFHLHPDKGGESDLMSILLEAYDQYKNHHKASFSAFREDDFEEFSGTYENVYCKIFKGNPRLEIMEVIRKYANTHPKFQTSYLESVAEFLEEHGYVTSSQFNAFVKIYYGFGMDQKEGG